MSKPDKNKEEKPKTQIRFRENAGGTSTIHRNDGLPSIDDKTENSIKWVQAQGYKPTDIEFIGQKPATWDAIMDPPKAAEIVDPMAAPANPEAVVAEVAPEATVA
jgi:hypothetical protein